MTSTFSSLPLNVTLFDKYQYSKNHNSETPSSHNELHVCILSDKYSKLHIVKRRMNLWELYEEELDCILLGAEFTEMKQVMTAPEPLPETGAAVRSPLMMLLAQGRWHPMRGVTGNCEAE